MAGNLSECFEALEAINQTLLELSEKIESCECPGDDPCGSSGAGVDNLGLHIGAVFIILFCSLLGVMLPLISIKLNLPSYPILLGKYFGTGIIITCALVHMLEPANESLTSACLGPAFSEDYGAYAYLFCIIAIFLMHGFEQILKGYVRKAMGVPEPDTELVGPSQVASLGHNHTPSDDLIKIDHAEIRAQAFMLEFGFTVHSIFIGLAVGVESENLVPLVIALSFHQFFEGIGLGSRLFAPGMHVCDAVILGCIFAISAPIGIMVGTIMVSSIAPEGLAFLLTQGIIDALCAGILLYVGFNMLFYDMPQDSKRIRQSITSRPQLRIFGLYWFLWSGAGLMAFIGRFL